MYTLLSGLMFALAIAVIVWLMRWSNRPDEARRDLGGIEEQTGARAFFVSLLEPFR
jgi:hypothetical protein